MDGRLRQPQLAADLGDAEVRTGLPAEEQEHIEGPLDGGDRLAAALAALDLDGPRGEVAGARGVGGVGGGCGVVGRLVGHGTIVAAGSTW